MGLQPSGSIEQIRADLQPIEYFRKGDSFKAQGRYWEAIQFYYKAVEINPDDEKAYCNIGFSLKALGRNL